MKKFFWGFMPYAVVSILFFVAIGGGDALVPASGESWFFPWTWSMDETRSMVVAGLNGMATITTLAFAALGMLVASTPMVEAKANEVMDRKKAKNSEEDDKARSQANRDRRPADEGMKAPPQEAVDKTAGVAGKAAGAAGETIFVQSGS